ncbi:MAG: bifunctional homocysteine S-methyltransferase/methylenetetrahydrofolate reductase, partial [Lentisphaerae bacterium]|nr:bifunctional homocysteine S-methyltransferase/methylenetetrahydrofolate reductase [Lentisphaerota bacterium]
DYVAAGADVIETNTFGANRIKLAEFGLAEKTGEINFRAVEIARKEAGNDVLVAASCGPCISDSTVQTEFSSAILNEVRDAFNEQISALAKAGVDLIFLETFTDFDELLVAAKISKQYSLPVLASISPVVFETSPVDEIVKKMDDCSDIDVIGLNCYFGPAEMFDIARKIRTLAKKPLVIMPNAGRPHEIGGRTLYLNSPEYFTEFAKKYIEIGANGIGGCCGTTPAHIRMASRAVHVMSGVKQHIEIADSGSAADTIQPPEALPLSEKSPFGKKIASGKPVTSVEIIPPRNHDGIEAFIEKCRMCERAGIDAINLPDGPRASARMSVIATAATMLRSNLEIEPVPHCCCRDRNLIGMQSDIIGGFSLGLKTWLFITGDPPKLGNYPDAAGVFDIDAVGATQLATNLNRGLDAAGQSLGAQIPITVGVGLNPVTVDFNREAQRFRAKVEAGAEFAITQPVFDTEVLLRFLDLLAEYSPMIPVVIGIYPLLSAKNADFMNRYVPGVHVPEKVVRRMEQCKDRETAISTGIEIARTTRSEIESAGFKNFQVSAPLGRTDIAIKVLA